MIEIISGVYGGVGGPKKPGDGAFSLPAKEEARLVRRGVARYVNEVAAEPAPVEPVLGDTVGGEELMDNIGPIGFDDVPPEDYPGADVEEVDLESLSAKELRELGAQYGLTFKGNASKAYMIEAITAELSKLKDDTDYGPGPDFDPSEAVV